MHHFGVVENRQDPLKLGRCKVRVVGVHTANKVDLPTEDLPWAFPVLPITSASMSGVGDAPVGPVEGSWVIVIFKDGDAKQQPVMLGTLPGIPEEESDGNGFSDPNKKYPLEWHLNEADTNRLARHESIEETIVALKDASVITNIPIGNEKNNEGWSQPSSPYNAMYPLNHVWQSESGNFYEHDDSPSVERIHEYHRSGTFNEVDANGTQVNRIVANGYEIVFGDKFVNVNGQAVVTINGSSTVYIGGDAHLDVQGKVNVTAKDNVNVSSKKKITLHAEDDFQVACKNFIVECESFGMKSKNTVDILAGSTVKIHGSKGWWQSKNAKPKAIDYDTWSKFARSSLTGIVPPPGRSVERALGTEGLSESELSAIGVDPQAKEYQPPLDAEGKPREIEKIESEQVTGAQEKPVETASEPECIFESSYPLSANYTLADVLKFPASGGKIVPQHGLTACDIVTNLRRVFAGTVEPMFAKYGNNLVLTSAFRYENGPYSKKHASGRPSRHELGLAVDFQFRDCKTHNDYVRRLKELRSLVAYDVMILESNSVTTWVHVQY